MRTAANRFVAEIKGEGKRETKRAKQIRDNTHTGHEKQMRMVKKATEFSLYNLFCTKEGGGSETVSQTV